MSTTEKLLQMVIAIALFVGVVVVVLVLADRVQSRRGEGAQTAAFVLPAVLMITLGLLYPAIRTIYESFRDANSTAFVGLDNYHTIFTDQALLSVLRNTAVWVVLTPLMATAIGLVYAILVDRARFEKFAKVLMFMPMAISLVGASHHLEVRLRLPLGGEPADRSAQRDPQGARLRHLPLPAHRAVEHVLPDRHHGLGAGRASR